MPEWIAYVRLNLRLQGFRPDREAEIVEEVKRQLEDAYAEALRLGSSREQAREAAEGHIADWTALARELEESWRGKESSMATLQNAAENRDFRKRGALSTLTDLRQDVLWIAGPEEESGIYHRRGPDAGVVHQANTSIFSILNAVMLKSLPVHDPAFAGVPVERAPLAQDSQLQFLRRLRVALCHDDNPLGCSLSKPFLEDVRKLGLFSGMAEFAGSGGITVSGNGEAHQANAQYVSGDYFQTLGVGAAVGRVLTPNDDLPDATAVVVLPAWLLDAPVRWRSSGRRQNHPSQ